MVFHFVKVFECIVLFLHLNAVTAAMMYIKTDYNTARPKIQRITCFVLTYRHITQNLKLALREIIDITGNYRHNGVTFCKDALDDLT